MRPLLALATAIVGLAALASPALAQDDPAQESPFGGELPPPLERPESRDRPAAGVRDLGGRRDSGRRRYGRRARGARGIARTRARGRSSAAIAGRSTMSTTARWSRSRSSTEPPARSTRPGATSRSRRRSPAATRARSRRRSTRHTSGCRCACCSWRRSSTPGGRCACCTWTCWCCWRSGVSLFLLQPRRDHGLGSAHLSGARLLPDPGAGRRLLAARARGPAGAAGRRFAGWRSGCSCWPPGGSRSTSPTRT